MQQKEGKSDATSPPKIPKKEKIDSSGGNFRDYQERRHLTVDLLTGRSTIVGERRAQQLN